MFKYVILIFLLGVALLYGQRFLARLQKKRDSVYQALPILTDNEHEFFNRIRGALPDMLVFPQMAMAALIKPNLRDKQKELQAFRQISQKRVDFVVCGQNLAVQCVIELDDRTHVRSQDAMRDHYLRSAGIATIRYESRAKPLPDVIAQDVYRCIAAKMELA
jgi:very-short-patch-repair endonuclease